MPPTPAPTFDVITGCKQPPTFELLVELGEAPVVRVFTPSYDDIADLRDWLLLPSTREAAFNALFDSLDELLARRAADTRPRSRQW